MAIGHIPSFDHGRYVKIVCTCNYSCGCKHTYIYNPSTWWHIYIYKWFLPHDVWIGLRCSLGTGRRYIAIILNDRKKKIIAAWNCVELPPASSFAYWQKMFLPITLELPMSFVARYLPDTDIHTVEGLWLIMGHCSSTLHCSSRSAEMRGQSFYCNPCMLALFFLRFHANWYSFMEASSRTISIYFRRTFVFADYSLVIKCGNGESSINGGFHGTIRITYIV